MGILNSIEVHNRMLIQRLSSSSFSMNNGFSSLELHVTFEMLPNEIEFNDFLVEEAVLLFSALLKRIP